MIYCFYTNNKAAINEYIKQYMLNSSIHSLKVWDSLNKSIETIPNDGSNQVGMFTEKTINIMAKIHIDIVNKVLDLACTIYNAGADRYLMDEKGNINDEQTNKLMDIYNKINISRVIVEIYKQGYIFNTVLAQPVWRNEQIEIDIITPNFCSVVPYDNDYKNAKIVMISKSVDDEDKIVYWSDSEHFYLDAEGNKTAITEVTGYDEDGKEITKSNGFKNPFKELPFAKLQFNCSSDFWGEPQQDLIENNIWYDVQEMNKYFVEMFQGLGVGLGINLGKNGVVSLSPNTMIQVDKVRAEDQTPSITFASTGAPLSELRDSLDYFYKRIGNSKGLSAQSMTNDVSDQSGISKAYDSAELQIKKDSHKLVMKQFEKELYEKIRSVYNYYNPDDKLDETLLFKLDIVEDEPMINVNDEIAITNFKLENNMVSIVELMIKNNPDMTDEEAIKQLTENKLINEKYLSYGKAQNETQPGSQGQAGISPGDSGI